MAKLNLLIPAYTDRTSSQIRGVTQESRKYLRNLLPGEECLYHETTMTHPYYNGDVAMRNAAQDEARGGYGFCLQRKKVKKQYGKSYTCYEYVYKRGNKPDDGVYKNFIIQVKPGEYEVEVDD